VPLFVEERMCVSKLIVDTGAAMTVLSWVILEGLGYDPGGTKDERELITRILERVAFGLDRKRKSVTEDDRPRGSSLA
jgi:hypothetical protein